MPRANTQGHRVEFRIQPEERALLVRAAALEHRDLTGFILETLLPAARLVIERADRLALTERDSLRVLEMLENPPPPPDRLIRAARAGHTLR